jgi:DNA-binding NarL/FixJ family response regulator
MEQTSEPGSRAVRVAIVDDFRLVMDGLEARLADPRSGVQVVALASSWAKLIAHPEFPAEVTVLDLHLGDAISIGTKIQALLAAGSEVVVISRHADPATVARAMDAGALGYIPKTEGIDELAAAIAAAARGERYLSEPLAAAIAGMAVPPAPRLGEQERRALAIYATGRTIRDVADEMGTTEETVKSYIKRARRKYREVGVELGNRALLRNHGIREGWLDPE